MSQRHRKYFLSEVKRALARAGVRRGASILVALSGGPDSVALLNALVELRESFGYRVAAAHLNHLLRGDESDRDETFCRELCRRLSLELIVERAQGLAPRKPNLEEAARKARLEFLHRTADAAGADYIALGHHADDQAETVLMRLLRGAGITGLCAMMEAGPGCIIRPMLSLSRRDVLDYLDTMSASFVTDATNFSTHILRNRVRHDLLPVLDREYVPGASRRLAALASEMQAVDAFLYRAAAQELSAIATSACGLELARFSNIDPALRVPVLRLYLTRQMGGLRRLTRDHLSALVNLCLAGPVNGEVALPGGWCALREYGHLQLLNGARPARPSFSIPIAFEGTTEVEAAGLAFDASVATPGDVPLPSNHESALFDAQAVFSSGLTVRNFLPGDRIRPLGMTGTRKVKEVFVDKRLPLRQRAGFPVVATGNQIVWLPGLLRGDGALVGGKSKAVLCLRMRQMVQH